MNDDDKKIIKSFNFYLKSIDFELIEAKQKEFLKNIFKIEKVIIKDYNTQDGTNDLCKDNKNELNLQQIESNLPNFPTNQVSGVLIQNPANLVIDHHGYSHNNNNIIQFTPQTINFNNVFTLLEENLKINKDIIKILSEDQYLNDVNILKNMISKVLAINSNKSNVL